MATHSNQPDALARFVDAGSAQAQQAVDRLSTAAVHTVDRLEAGTQDMLGRAADNAVDYAARSGQLLDDARDRIAAYPWHALGIAAAAGFVLMRMLR